mmetsp:Transcript_17659/g.26130  ORF Transcript_17659/g.26130 Transcript_17659/m.26130 type:complete len:219 (+) Transcript_17659:93-749(+)
MFSTRMFCLCARIRMRPTPGPKATWKLPRELKFPCSKMRARGKKLYAQGSSSSPGDSDLGYEVKSIVLSRAGSVYAALYPLIYGTICFEANDLTISYCSSASTISSRSSSLATSLSAGGAKRLNAFAMLIGALPSPPVPRRFLCCPEPSFLAGKAPAFEPGCCSAPLDEEGFESWSRLGPLPSSSSIRALFRLRAPKTARRGCRLAKVVGRVSPHEMS